MCILVKANIGYFMTKTRVFNLISILLNTFIVIVTIISAVRLGSNPTLSGGNFFQYYTNLSNVFIGVMSLLTIPYNIINIIFNKERFPLWLRILKFIATCATTLTFLTVILFLGPTQGYDKMLEDVLIFYHLLTPIAALICFTVLENKQGFNWKFAFIGVSSSIVYGIIYMINVLGTGIWEDFYGFTKFLHPAGMFILMQIAMLAISFGVYFLQVLCRKHIR